MGRHGTDGIVGLKTGMGTGLSNKLGSLDRSVGIGSFGGRYRINTINDYRMKGLDTKGSEIRDLKGCRI